MVDLDQGLGECSALIQDLESERAEAPQAHCGGSRLDGVYRSRHSVHAEASREIADGRLGQGRQQSL